LSLRSALKGSLSAGLIAALRLVRSEIHLYRLHRAGVKRASAYSALTGLKLNIGCGANRKPGWVNIDLAPNVDLSLDLRERIPLADGSARLIYSEHFFEHLDYPGDALRFLGECRRLLAPGGIFSVGVPDTEWPLAAYVGPDDKGYFALMQEKQWHPAWCHTRLDHINYHFRQDGEHRYAYDFESLEHALAQTGFKLIRRREFDPDLDSKEREQGTLYVEATR